MLAIPITSVSMRLDWSDMTKWLLSSFAVSAASFSLIAMHALNTNKLYLADLSRLSIEKKEIQLQHFNPSSTWILSAEPCASVSTLANWSRHGGGPRTCIFRSHLNKSFATTSEVQQLPRMHGNEQSKKVIELFLAKWHLSCPEITRVSFPSSKIYYNKNTYPRRRLGEQTRWRPRRSWNETAAATRRIHSWWVKNQAGPVKEREDKIQS